MTEYTQDKLNELQKNSIGARQNADACRRALRLAEREEDEADRAFDDFVAGYRRELDKAEREQPK